MKKLSILLLFTGLLLKTDVTDAAAVADPGGIPQDESVAKLVHDKFSGDPDLYNKVESYLTEKGAIDDGMAEFILPDQTNFSPFWSRLTESQRQAVYEIVFPKEMTKGAAVASGGSGGGAAAGGSGGGAADTAEIANGLYDKFSINPEIYTKIKDYLSENTSMASERLDNYLTDKKGFSVFFNGLLTDDHKNAIHGLVYSDGAAAGGSSGGAAAGGSSGGSSTGGSSGGSSAPLIPAIPSTAVTGALTKPEGAAGMISKAWYRIGASQLYRQTYGMAYLPKVPLVHEYNPALTRIYFAGKFASGKLALPAFVTAGGAPENVYVVVMQSGWSEPTLFRPHYAIHTKDDEATSVKFTAGESDFAPGGTSGEQTVKMHTHWQDPPEGDDRPRDVVASPNEGPINLGGAAKDVASGSFWVVATVNGKKMAVLYWLVNNGALQDELERITGTASTIEGMMAALKTKLADNPQAIRLRKLFKYE